MIPITTTSALGQVLQRYRKDKGMTQIEVAEKFRMTQKTIHQIENGHSGIKLETFFKVLSTLELEMHLVPRKQESDEELW